MSTNPNITNNNNPPNAVATDNQATFRVSSRKSAGLSVVVDEVVVVCKSEIGTCMA